MALDRISEEISHFIGLFHLEIEAAKLRLDYQAFKVAQDGPALDPLSGDPFSGRSDLPKGHVKTGLDNPKFPADAPVAGPPAVAAFLPQSPQAFPDKLQSDPVEITFPVLGLGGLTITGPSFEIMPNSIVLVIQQSAYLTDNDLLLFDGSANFTDPAVFLTLLMDLGELAQSLSLIDPWIWSPADGPVYDSVMKMVEALEQADLPQQDGVAAVLLRGEEAEGIFVNGEKVDELPLIKDLLPKFLREDETEEDDLPALAARSDGVTDHDPAPFGVDPGHHVVTGGNRVINETVLKSVWVDAPVIAVAQNVLRLDVISQVNIRMDASDLPDQTAPAPSTSMNVAMLEQKTAMAEGSDGQSGKTAAQDGLPSFWNVTRLEGDLMLMNWVQQHIFVSDYDRVEVKFTGAATYIGTGENIVFNETLILNLGFHYDLIMIGGSMITLNQISQINVMLDQDRITGDVPEGATLHAGDNLQLNMAVISTTGVDSQAAQSDHFAKALADLKAGSNTLSAEVAHDELFAGKEMLSVLYIEGDLIQTNVIEQINYLGDSDQIHFIQDMFSTAAGAEVTVTSGSNAQINAAKIVSAGLDSTVMAGGDTYSDALIYQAELIDDGAAPTGVQMGALASEAVAFLADGMIPPAPDEEYGTPVQSQDSAGSVDIMQTMLA
ncbi:MAG: hypothetical protein ACNA7O_14655 [Rhodobacterales bacterium]